MSVGMKKISRERMSEVEKRDRIRPHLRARMTKKQCFGLL
jgi:hypothetical protein